MDDKAKIKRLEAEIALLKRSIFRMAWELVHNTTQGIFGKIREEIHMSMDNSRFCDEPEFEEFDVPTMAMEQLPS